MIELNKKTMLRIFFGVCGCIVLYWLLHETASVGNALSVILGIFSPFITGACIAFVLNVPMRAFEKLLSKIKKPGLRRGIALILTFIAVLLVLTVVFVLLIPQVAETVRTLIPKLTDFFVGLETKIEIILEENPELLRLVGEPFDLSAIVQEVLVVVGNSLTTIVQGAFSAIGSVFGTVMNLFISVVFSVYCLFQKEKLAQQGRKLAYAFLSEKHADRVIHILRLSNSTFSNFLSGQCIEVCILGSMFAIAMAILGMPYIPLVSVLVAVTAFIPIVGAWIGCSLGAFFMLVNDPMQAVWFVIMFLILQQIEGNLIYPRVVGTSIGLSGMWVLLAVSVGGALFGIAGMFLMIPMTSVIYTILRERTNRRLTKRGIDPAKLEAQPPELRSHIKEKHRFRKAKRAKKKEEKNNAQ